MSDEVEVRAVPAEVTFPLRQAVLRPHQRVDELALPTDGDPATGHYAAFDGGGRVVGTGMVSRVSPWWAPDQPGWQVRGMAVEPSLRGRGIGSAILGVLLEHVRDHGGGLAWCNARTPARRLYEHAGFTTIGEPFELEHIGPHIAMAREVQA